MIPQPHHHRHRRPLPSRARRGAKNVLTVLSPVLIICVFLSSAGLLILAKIHLYSGHMTWGWAALGLAASVILGVFNWMTGD